MTLVSVSDVQDLELRATAAKHTRQIQRRYDDLVPVTALMEKFVFRGELISLGAPFYKGIFRPRQMVGPAALTIATTPPKNGRPAPYEDAFDENTGRFTYRFRDPREPTVAARRAADADNRALLAAHELAVPLIYFRGIAPAQYAIVAPVFIMHVDPSQRLVEMEAGLPVADMTAAGLVSDADVRQYATREALYRLHQHRFRAAVLRAYSTRCAVCRLREAALLQAAHIVDDHEPAGHATVVNGLALCAIHHLAYDRNLLGIDPEGVVHIARRLLNERDGPMLSTGLQGFHGARILTPRQVDQRPDPDRLRLRFQTFTGAAV